jgi:hypothetical protein
MTTIDKLVQEAGVGPFQMIKLDIQGKMPVLARAQPSPGATLHVRPSFDLEAGLIVAPGAEIVALKGAAAVLKTVEVIVTETSNVEYNKGAPQV